MQRNMVKIGIVVLLAVLLIGLPVATGCAKPAAPAPQPGPAPAVTPAPAPAPTPAPKVETPKEIKVGIMGGQTGPAAPAVSAMFQDIEQIFRYVNEVEGGIDGIKLKWKVVDNKGTLEGAVLSYKELKEGFNPLFYFLVEDYYYLGIKDTMTADKAVSFTSSAIDSRAYVPPGIFYCISLPIADGFGAFTKWVMNDWKGTGKPKIGVLYWELASGQQYRAAEGFAVKQGVELVPIQYPMVLMDLKPQLMKAQEAKVDYIWMQCTAPQAAVAVRDARALGIAGKTPFVFNEYVEPDVLLNIAGEAADGFYSYRSESPVSDNAPASQLYTKIMSWAINKEKKNENRLPMTLKYAITAMIKQAVKDVGYEKLDRDALINALNKMTSIDTMGNIKNLSYGPDRRIGITAIRMSKITKTGTVSVGDWIDMPRIFEGKEK